MQTEMAIPINRVTVVDDDELFLESLSTNLANAGYQTDLFSSGDDAIDHLLKKPDTDLIILDWKMPGITGIEVMQRLRAQKVDIPIIFLTVLSDQIYEEAGLLGGAVDFIEKSRSFSILQRRIELTLSGKRKTGSEEEMPDTKEKTGHGHLSLRYDSKRAQWRDVNVGLTLTEFNIVAHLVKNAARDISYREVYDLVHGEGFFAGDGDAGYRTNVRAFIRRIRQKFRDIDAEFSQIKNYPGFGYRWVDGSEE